MLQARVVGVGPIPVTPLSFPSSHGVLQTSLSLACTRWGPGQQEAASIFFPGLPGWVSVQVAPWALDLACPCAAWQEIPH